MTVALNDLRVLVISLERAADRRRLMAAQLDWPGMPPYEFLSAVDGRQMDVDQRNAVYDEASAILYNRALTAPEIGCAASHIQAYRRVLDDGLPAALILEDDALLGHQFTSVLAGLLESLDPAKPQVILLSHVRRYSAWPSRRIDKRHRLYRPYKPFGAHAYLVTNAGAGAMLATMQPIRTVADDWRFIMSAGRADVRAVVPYPVGTMPAANQSQIGEERLAGAKKRRGVLHWPRKQWAKLVFVFVTRPFLLLKQQESTW